MKKKYAAQYAWKKRNPEKVKKINQAWQKANPDKMKTYYETAYRKNGDKIRARKRKSSRLRRAENPELFRKRDRAYYKANFWKFVTGRQSSEMREVLFVLTGRKP